MTAGEHTKRDTFAFALVILGATLWTVFPAVRFLKDEGYGPEIGLPITFGAGSLLGAWAGTTVWRHVSWVIPAVAATLFATVLVVLQSKSWNGTVVVGVHEVIRVTSATAGALAGAFLARAARLPKRALVAALVTLGGPSFLGLAIGVAYAIGYELWSRGAAWVVMLSIWPTAVIAVRLCGGVHPKAYWSWMFGLLASAFLISLADDRTRSPLGMFVLSMLMGGVLASIASIPVLVIHARRPAAEELPSAQVVDR